MFFSRKGGASQVLLLRSRSLRNGADRRLTWLQAFAQVYFERGPTQLCFSWGGFAELVLCSHNLARFE